MSDPQFPRLPLDPMMFNLDEEEIAFFKEQSGIHDDDLLRDHILKVQAEAYQVYPYPCILLLSFARFNISKFPAYLDALILGKERKNAIMLDVGCCMGSDIRKAIADGFPRENVITSDLHSEFWVLGHKLFKTTHETFPIPFIAGDLLDPSVVSPTASPAPTCTTSLDSPPPLATLTSLTPLQHHISVIYTAMMFHLVGEEKQRTMAHILGTLLSPLPGSMIFGTHLGAADTEENKDGGKWKSERGIWSFGHSATSWKNMWMGEGGVFEPGDVIVKVGTKEFFSKYLDHLGGEPTPASHLLYWSVTRASI